MPSLNRLTWLAAPLIAFAALFAIMTSINASAPTPVSPAADAELRELTPGAGAATRIDELRELEGLEPGNAQVPAALGDAYYQRSRETGDPAFHAKALRAYERALVTDPGSVAAVAGQATVELARHNFADGLVLARRAHRLEPALVAPYAGLVDSLIETGRYAAAGRALDRMISLKPNLASYLRVSYFRELHGDLPGAAQALRLAVSAGSATVEGSAYIRSLLGDFEAMRGRYGAAKTAYREALAVDPQYGGALRGMALLQAGRGELGQAIEALRAQLGAPPSPDVLIALGEVEEAAGRIGAARRHYAQAGELERELLARGSGFDAGVTLNEAGHGDPIQAVIYGRKAWRSAPSVSSADAYSWALYRAGRIEAATRLSSEAMRLGSRNPEFLFHAGMIARAAGQRGRAGRLLEELLDQSPRFSALYAPRAKRALRNLG